MPHRGYESDDSDFAAAVAASANAVHYHEELGPKVDFRRANTRKQEPFRPPQGGSIRKVSIKETRSSSSLRPAISFSEDQRHKEASMTIRGSDSRSDAWEKAKIAKIHKRYENVESEIKAWEKEKKVREKHQMERKKGELELRKSRNLKHYHSKIARIDDMAREARLQVEEKRKHEESVVKARARKMRLTGKTPVSCFCF